MVLTAGFITEIKIDRNRDEVDTFSDPDYGVKLILKVNSNSNSIAI